ncbi:MAG: hypothetical protein ACLT3Y_04100 [Ruminococcus callidus]
MIQMKENVILAGALACAAVVCGRPMQCRQARRLASVYRSQRRSTRTPGDHQGDGQYTVSCDTAAPGRIRCSCGWKTLTRFRWEQGFNKHDVDSSGTAVLRRRTAISSKMRDGLGYSKDVFCDDLSFRTDVRCGNQSPDVTLRCRIVDPATYVPSNVSTVVATGTTTIQSGSSSGASNGGGSVTGRRREGHTRLSETGCRRVQADGSTGCQGSAAFLAKKA